MPDIPFNLRTQLWYPSLSGKKARCHNRTAKKETHLCEKEPFSKIKQQESRYKPECHYRDFKDHQDNFQTLFSSFTHDGIRYLGSVFN
ncbi:MAG: hypothetical protein JST46_05265 [Bacteroidetes bacterium]|nr:hypothetical protein [Bacteroidota bacterium]